MIDTEQFRKQMEKQAEQIRNSFDQARKPDRVVEGVLLSEVVAVSLKDGCVYLRNGDKMVYPSDGEAARLLAEWKKWVHGENE